MTDSEIYKCLRCRKRGEHCQGRVKKCQCACVDKCNLAICDICDKPQATSKGFRTRPRHHYHNDYYPRDFHLCGKRKVTEFRGVEGLNPQYYFGTTGLCAEHTALYVRWLRSNMRTTANQAKTFKKRSDAIGRILKSLEKEAAK